MFGFKTKQDLVSRTQRLVSGLRVKLGRKQSNNSNLNTLICVVLSVPREELAKR